MIYGFASVLKIYFRMFFMQYYNIMGISSNNIDTYIKEYILSRQYSY